MKRIQIQLDEDQLRVLKARAARENVSVAGLVRRAVDAWMRRDSQPPGAELRRRAGSAAGRFASGRADVAEHHDEYLAGAFRAEPERTEPDR